MVMRIQISKAKSIVAFMLVLCLTMPLFVSVASASIVATHTHVCHDDEKVVCLDARECCTICINFHEVKYRFQNRYCNIADRFPATIIPSLVSSFSELSYLCSSADTLVSLKVRLNN